MARSICRPPRSESGETRAIPDSHPDPTTRWHSPDSPPRLSTSAERTRNYRDRARHHRRLIRVEVSESVIDALVAEGYLGEADTVDDRLVSAAIVRKLHASTTRKRFL